jgi:hypothetical protein
MLEMANMRSAMFESKIYKGCIQPQPRGSSPTRKRMVYGFVCRGRLSDSGCELWWRVPQLFNVLLNTWKQLNGEDLTCFRFSRLKRATRQSPTPFSLLLSLSFLLDVIGSNFSIILALSDRIPLLLLERNPFQFPRFKRWLFL